LADNLSVQKHVGPIIFTIYGQEQYNVEASRENAKKAWTRIELSLGR